MGENGLVIDTAGRAGRVGLVRGGAVAGAVALDAARRHARDLTTAVDGLLRAGGLRPADLSDVTVSIGPGSYTGLRVGVMAAKALAYATGCALVPVPTFLAVAARAPAEAANLWVIADALQGQVYLQRFRRAAGGFVPTEPLRIEAASESLTGAPADAWFTGPGVAVYESTHIPQTCRLVAEADREPTVESLYAAGRGVAPATRAELFALEPLYLRGSSAEEAAKKRGG
jgi:tRNA threonylcarbamoyladenosine biosynthesis protein TsaB